MELSLFLCTYLGRYASSSLQKSSFNQTLISFLDCALILFSATIVSVSIVEDGSSSSPPQAPLITQPLSDSDDPQLSLHKSTNLKSRHYCQIGNFESDSFNENFSPTRPANSRRKRKYKKMPIEYTDGKQPPDVELLSVASGVSDLFRFGLITAIHTSHLRNHKKNNQLCNIHYLFQIPLPVTIDIENQALSPSIHVSVVHKPKTERLFTILIVFSANVLLDVLCLATSPYN